MPVLFDPGCGEWEDGRSTDLLCYNEDEAFVDDEAFEDLWTVILYSDILKLARRQHYRQQSRCW